MDPYFHTSFNNVFVQGYLCTPTDKLNVEDAMKEPLTVVTFGIDEIHELVLRTSVDSMYPTGELVFRTSKIDTMSKALLQQIAFMRLEIEVSHIEDGAKKVDRTDSAYYVVSSIVENKLLEDAYETRNGRDRFYNITFDSIRKLNFHGNCVYSTYAPRKPGDADYSGDLPGDILKKVFKDVGVPLETKYAPDMSRMHYITSNNATARTVFQYIAKRMFDHFKTDAVDVPFLSYDAMGGAYQLLSLGGLAQRSKDKKDEMDSIMYGDAWAFQIVANHENSTEDATTDATYFGIKIGFGNKNDVVKTFYNRVRTDYDPEFDFFTESKNVPIDRMVLGLLPMNAPAVKGIGSNFKMVPAKQFLDVADKDFERNRDKFVATCRSSTFRDNIYADAYMWRMMFGSDRLELDAPGNMVRTVGDVVYVRTDNDPNNDFNLNKYQGEYILTTIVHRFRKAENGKAVYRNELELATTSSTQSDIQVA